VPPEWALRALAAWLREALGLSLFNFDLIAPEPGVHTASCGAGSAERSHSCAGCDGAQDPLLYYVVDINYLPGYDKLGDGAQRALGAYLAARTRAAASAEAGPAAEAGQAVAAAAAVAR
jgi:hypothetical protein